MCWNKGRLCWNIAKLYYFCHLKMLVRPETFGPYHVYHAKVLKGVRVPLHAFITSCVWIHAAVAYCSVVAPRYPLEAMCVPRVVPDPLQNNPLSLLGIEPRIFARPTTTLVTELTRSRSLRFLRKWMLADNIFIYRSTNSVERQPLWLVAPLVSNKICMRPRCG